MKTSRWVLIASLSLLCLPLRAFADWPPISPEDLSMTSIKEQPNAPAFILLREEIDDDMNNVHSTFERIKILTDAGREYANVELPYSRRGFSIGAISGRTIHPDGSVTPFEGKPFDKIVEKGQGLKWRVKSFTLPDVQVGSIIDYRYSLRYDDQSVLPPEWQVQRELFQRKAYFKFVPFQNHGGFVEIMLDHGQVSNGIAWTPFLSEGPAPQVHNVARSTFATVHDVNYWIDLTRENIPAFIEEPFMPPPSILKQRVYFYYQQNLKVDDYWKAEGKFWNKDAESFLGKDRGIRDALTKIIAPADMPEQKVRKIHAFVASLENQNYIPERTIQENKFLELKANKGVDDVLEHRSGSHDELNRLFVAMVKAAGIQASLIWVPDRSQEMFIKDYLSTGQLDAEVAVVQLDGKDVFLDPGSKFCPYGIVDWRYTGVYGLRQVPGKGTEVSQTPMPSYTQAVMTRMADVALDQNGAINGTVSLVFKGLSAMAERQEGGKTDSEGRKKMLEDKLRKMLPGNSEVTMLGTPDWDSTEKPLIAQFRISCPFAVAAGKRLMLTQHLFQVNEKAKFAASQRSNAVYFSYPWQEADEVHIKLPAGMEVESLVPNDLVKLEYALYQSQQKQEAPDKIFARRDFVIASGLVTPDKYKEIKGFFDKVKADDDQAALVKVTTSVATTN